jgi:DNA-binding response OmpR family regulator
MLKILIGEDTLDKNHTIFYPYDVDSINSYDEFMEASFNKNYDLYILNIYYFNAVVELQKSGDETNVIFIDEFYSINQLKKALMIGDDYMIKPVYLEELEIRVKYHCRKLFKQTNNILIYKNFYFHVDSKQLFLGTDKVKLSPNELKLVGLFFTHIDKAISKDIIYDLLESSSDGSLRVYISKLNKLGLHVEYERSSISYTLKS